MSTTDDLKTYYSSLLIMQYNQKPNAIATIQTLSGAAIADNLEGQMKDAFDLDTAIGKQLDILGNLVGVSRVLPVDLPAPDYFSTVDSDAPSTALTGFSSSDVPIVVPYWYFYGAYPTASLWSMDDDTYRKLIKYIIQLNKSDFGLYDIARILLTVPRNPTTFFGLGDTGLAVAITGVGTITPTVMQVVFCIYQNGIPDLLFKAILAAKALPVPAGVEVLLYVDSVLTPY